MRLRVVRPLIILIYTGAMLTFMPTAHAQISPQGITLEGNILTAAGVPEESSSVHFTIQIKSPGLEGCVLYQESQTLNMSDSGGMFALTIGDGVRPGSGFETTSSLKTAFNNAQGLMTGLTCASGSTYTPVLGDRRDVLLNFNDGTGGTQTITQAMAVQSVPYALYADTLQGKLPGDFVAVNNATAALTQANLELIFNSGANVTKLQDLIAGTSGEYAKTTAAGGASLPVYAGAPTAPGPGAIWYDSTAGKLTFYDGTSPQVIGTSGGSVTSIIAGAGLSGGTITTSGTISMPNVGTAGTYFKVTTDAQGRVTAGAALAAADIPNLDAAKITTGTLSSSLIPSGTDATKLPLAGGTMSGAIAMGSQNITGTGYITMSSGKYLGLGIYDDTTEATLVTSTLTAGGVTYKGVTWFNSTSNAIKYWDGGAAVAVATGSTAISTLNGLTTATQSFAVGTSGTAPAFNSSVSTHTLNIPMAATASVTAGLLSNAEYTGFIKKDGTVAYTADQSLGSHKLTSVTDPTSAQDAATKNYADTKIATKAVATSVATAITGSAGNGFVLTWDQTGNQWTAAAPASAGTVTSVGLALPSIFSVTGSPVTTSGTLTGSLATQTANLVFAGPSSGGAAAPTFRTLANADLPAVTVAKGGTGSTSLTPNGLLMADGTGTSVSAGVCGTGQTYVSSGTAYSCQTVGTSTTGFLNGGNSFGAAAVLGTIDSNSLTLLTGNSARMTLDTSGNVGIGTSTPLGLLDVGGQIASASLNNWAHIGTNVGLTTPPWTSNPVGLMIGWNKSNGQAETNLAFSTWGANSGLNIAGWDGATYSEYMRIAKGGNVGIGTAAPATAFDLNGAISLRAMAVPALSPSAQGRLYFDVGTNQLMLSQNGGAYVALATTSGGQTISGAETFSGAITAGGAGTSLTVTNNATVGGTFSVTSVTPSTSSTTGAATVAGGLGVSGAVNTSGAINSGSTISAVNSVTAPYIYGSSAPSGTLTLDGTSNATPGNVLINPTGGNVGIGTAAPAGILDVQRATGAYNAVAAPINLTAQSGNGAVAGGAINLIAGSSTNDANAVGGSINLTGGTSAGGAPGSINLLGGANTSAGSSLFGGSVNIQGGPASYSTFSGGSVYLRGGVASSNANGGNIILLPSAGNGTGSSGNVGIGTTSPQAALDVTGSNGIGVQIANTSSNANSQSPSLNIINYSGGFTGSPYIGLAQRRGTGVSPSAVLSGDTLAYIGAMGGNGSGYGLNEAARIVMKSTESFSATNGGGSIGFYTASNGTTSDNVRMTIDQSGNVGIGTTTPSGILSVTPGQYSAGTATQSGTTVTGTGTTWTAAMVGSQFVFADGTSAGTITARASNTSMTVTASHTVASQAYSIAYTGLQVDSTGRVGVGTSSPSFTLDVNGVLRATSIQAGALASNGTIVAQTWHADSYASSSSSQNSPEPGYNQLTVTNANQNDGKQAMMSFSPSNSIPNSQSVYLGAYSVAGAGSYTPVFVIGQQTGATSYAERMRIDTAGNVGIGTTSPTNKLEVVGNLAASSAMIGGTLLLNWDSNVSHFAISSNGDTYITSNLNNATSNNIILKPSGTGNVGIGTTTPGYRLDVQGGDINASGSVRAAGVALTSDIRYKRDIEPLDRALEKILNIRGVSYNWRREEFPQKQFNERHQIGVIAQEVESQFPEVVDTNNDGYKSVNYPALVAPVIEAIKTLYQRILGIEARQDQLNREMASKVDKAETDALRADNRAKDQKIKALELRLKQQEIETKARLDKIEKMLSAK